MVSSVSTNANSLSQLMLWFQQQAQLNAANNAAQNNGNTSGSTQAVSGASSNNLISSTQGISGNALLALLQSQQVSDPSDTSGQSNGQTNGFGQDFQNLASAIQAGDLTDAQQAYTTLSQLQTASGINDPNASTDGPASGNPFQQALNQIGSDLQSGNMTGAQQTLASMQQTQEGGQHHHHHHDGGSAANSAGAGDDLASLLDGGSSSTSSSSSGSSTTQPVTVTNADGSITTITTNADGSVTTTTTLSPQTASSDPSDTNTLQDLMAALEQITV